MPQKYAEKCQKPEQKRLLRVFALADEPSIERVPVASSHIASVGFDRDRKILEVEFHKGAVYQYFDVPERVYLGLVNSPSHGAYYVHELKHKYYSKDK